ncbi:hypothetical protein [Cupriavidus sp. TMH.W2]|uniref:hypothetical protein n=1 Tax=Cupriavidus sp. TMH.W2 TaxID=3434465 RepID=UPI003D776247
MKNRFYNNGNFTGTTQVALIAVGTILLPGTLYIEIKPRWLAASLVLLGFSCIFVGAFSARAQLSGLRVFGKPDWKKAKETYNDQERVKNDSHEGTQNSNR